MFDSSMKVTGFGGLTKDPQISYNNNGTAFLKFSLGVSRSRKVNNDWVQDNNYFDCVVIGKYAEALQNHLSKGVQVFISGDLKFESWQTDGQTRTKVSIKVDELEIISKGNNQQNNNQSQNNRSYQQNNSQPSYQNYQQNNNQGGGGFIDDVPFMRVSDELIL